MKKKEKLLLIQYLRLTDSEFEKDFLCNMKLLENNNLKFSGSMPEHLGNGELLTGYTGKMMVNGRVHLDARTSWGGYSIHPLIGEINALGDVVLENNSQLKHSYRGCIISYLGATNDSGQLSLSIDQLKKQSFFIGNKYMSKLIYDPFNKDDIKRREFIRIRKQLLKKIKVTRDYFRDQV